MTSKRKSDGDQDDDQPCKKKIIESVSQPKTPRGGSKRTFSDQGQKNLEQIALRTLKRLEREDKIRKLQEAKEVRSETSAPRSISSGTLEKEEGGSTASASTDSAPCRTQQEQEDSMIAWKEELLAEMSEEALNFLEFKVENECLMVKPIKTKNQEFNMKEATCEER